jgi:hypothetical protein
LKISKFSGGSVSVFSKNQNPAVGMKKPYSENIGRRFGRLVAVEYVGVKSGSSIWRFSAAHRRSLVGLSRRLIRDAWKVNPSRSF